MLTTAAQIARTLCKQSALAMRGSIESMLSPFDS